LNSCSVGSGVWPELSPRGPQRDYRMSPKLKRNCWLVTAETRRRNEPGYLPLPGCFEIRHSAPSWRLLDRHSFFSDVYGCGGLSFQDFLGCHLTNRSKTYPQLSRRYLVSGL
jgi:hypothetical protein